MKVLELTRIDYLQTGIFGTLIDPNNDFAVFTLEHAYPIANADSTSTNWAPKVPKGVYKCIRGQHQLKGMTEPFVTFEVTEVPGHTGILFHCGNTEADSEGCILLGMERDGDKEILQSREAFQLFIKNLEGIDQFTLVIS
jgi:Family of unknown function (DUF5675)